MILPCDRKKNIKCLRVQNNMPCGECKGTKYEEFAKVTYKRERKRSKER